MKLYEGFFVEINGEHEYGHSKLVYANTLEEAKRAFMGFLRSWYDYEDEDDVEPYDDIGWSFFGGTIVVKLYQVMETTETAFKNREFNGALIL